MEIAQFRAPRPSKTGVITPVSLDQKWLFQHPASDSSGRSPVSSGAIQSIRHVTRDTVDVPAMGSMLHRGCALHLSRQDITYHVVAFLGRGDYLLVGRNRVSTPPRLALLGTICYRGR